MMRYNSKQVLVELFTTLALSLGYVFFTLGANGPEHTDIPAHAKAILIFIGILILVNILTQIIFHIFFSAQVAYEASQNQEEKFVNRIIDSSVRQDERDRLITQKASFQTSFIFSTGFIISLIVLSFGGKVVTAVNILLAAFILTSLADSYLKFKFYERSDR